MFKKHNLKNRVSNNTNIVYNRMYNIYAHSKIPNVGLNINEKVKNNGVTLSFDLLN